MKYAVAVDLINTVVIDPAVVSDDMSIPEWDPNNMDYAFEAVVKVTADRKKYKLAAQSAEVGVPPSSVPDIWTPSPLDVYAPFNYKNTAMGVFTGTYGFTINDAFFLDTLYFQDIDGDTIKVELLDQNDQVLDTLEENIYEWDMTDFPSFLFPDDPVRKRKIQLDFVDIFMKKIKVTISGESISMRYIVAGYKQDAGMTLEDGIEYRQNNFFTQERDGWGDIIDTQVRVIEDLSIPVVSTNEYANRNIDKLSALYEKDVLYIADDREKRMTDFQFLNVFARSAGLRATPRRKSTTKILRIQGK